MSGFEAHVRWATLAAAVDSVVPADDWPGGWAGGVAALIEHEPAIVLPTVDAVRPLLVALEAEARRTTGGSAFADLTIERQQAILEAFGGSDDHAAGMAALVRLSLQGFYAGAKHGDRLGSG